MFMTREDISSQASSAANLLRDVELISARKGKVLFASASYDFCLLKCPRAHTKFVRVDRALLNAFVKDLWKSDVLQMKMSRCILLVAFSVLASDVCAGADTSQKDLSGLTSVNLSFCSK